MRYEIASLSLAIRSRYSVSVSMRSSTSLVSAYASFFKSSSCVSEGIVFRRMRRTLCARRDAHPMRARADGHRQHLKLESPRNLRGGEVRGVPGGGASFGVIRESGRT